VPASARQLLRLLFALAALQPLSAQEPEEQSWFLILIGGKRAGSQSEIVWRQPGGGFRTELRLRLAVNRFGQTFTITQRQSWLEGESLQSLESETDLNGTAEFLTARLTDEGLRLSERRAGGSSERLLPAGAGLLGPRGAEQRLREALAAGPARSPRELAFRQFSPETGGVQEVRLRLLGEGELTDTRGVVHRGRRVDLESSAAPGVRTEALYDEGAGLLYSVTRAGILLEMVCGSSTAGGIGGETAGEASDLELYEVAALAIPVRWPADRRGPDPRLASLRSVKLRFTGPALAELERAIRAEQVDLGGPELLQAGPAVVLHLKAAPPPPAWPQAPAGGGELAGGGFYLDLGDPRLEELAALCSPPAFACLERLVDRTIRTKSLRHGFAGVGEVLDSRAGDCTEHALLLAALLRKRGVPARIAYGFLLTEAGFIGHAWTEARAGAGWFRLDPSFPGGRPYAFKVRLGVIDPAEPVWGQIGVSLLTVAGGVQAEVLEADDGR
jgi:hypothetical protein